MEFDFFRMTDSTSKILLNVIFSYLDPSSFKISPLNINTFKVFGVSQWIDGQILRILLDVHIKD